MIKVSPPTLTSYLPSAASRATRAEGNATTGRKQRYSRPTVDNLSRTWRKDFLNA